MSAFIAATLHINPDALDEDEWHLAWARTKLYLEVVHQVKWS